MGGARLREVSVSGGSTVFQVMPEFSIYTESSVLDALQNEEPSTTPKEQGEVVCKTVCEEDQRI